MPIDPESAGRATSSSAITAPRGSSVGRSSASTVDHLDIALHQDGIAVPAEVAGIEP